MTERTKAKIDSMSYAEMLEKWRFSEIGSPWFQGETGAYFAKTMAEKRNAIDDETKVALSKALGWEKC
jgi:hypothetical protein